MKSPNPKPISLSELIYQVKQDLLRSDIREKDPLPLFAVDEIEIQAVVSISREGEAGVNIQVISIGGGLSRQDTQTVRVLLKPLRTREELLAELKVKDPQLYEQILRESPNLLKGVEA
jgi:hypothetical protein